MILRSLLVWASLMLIETAHGILRSQYLAPLLSDFRSRQIGVATGSVLILGATILVFPWMRARSARSYLAIGVLWVVLTVGYEFSLGRLLGLPWSRLLADYDLPRGGLLPIGLLVMALAPLIAARIRS